MQIAKEMAGGLTAGVVGTTIGYPLDLVKTRMQTNPTTFKNKNFLSSVLNISKSEGFASLYKGVAAPLLSLSILNTVNFASYMSFRRLLLPGVDNDANLAGWDERIFFAGCMVAPVTAIISTPEHVVKTQMQLDNKDGGKGKGKGKGKYTSSMNCAKTLVKGPGGWKNLYAGFQVNAYREYAFLGTYFFCYEGLKKTLRDLGVGRELSVPVAGGCAGAIGWTVSLPLDCVKAQIMSQDLSVKEFERPRMIFTRVLADILKTRGVASLYSGLAPSVFRAFLVSGSRFSAYEFAMRMFDQGRE